MSHGSVPGRTRAITFAVAGVGLLIGALLAQAPPATARMASQAQAVNTWAGSWETNFGTMTLRQTGTAVEGEYTYDQGHVAGQVAGNVFTGRWDEAPTRTGPVDAGPFELTLQADGKSFTGRWRHDADASWWPDPWNGTCTAGDCLRNGTPPATTCPPVGSASRATPAVGQTAAPCHVVSRLEKAYARYALSHWSALYYLYGCWFYPGLCQEVVDGIRGWTHVYNDPPDARFSRVALARSRRAARQPPSPSCGDARGRRCARLRRAAADYRQALSLVSGAVQGLATAVDRFSGAQRTGASADALAQSGAAKAFAGLLAQSVARLHAPGVALTRALRRAGRPLRLSRSQLKRGLVRGRHKARKRKDKRLLSATIKRLPSSVDLGPLLTARRPVGAFAASQHSIAVGEARALAEALSRQGAIAPASAALLSADLDALERADQAARPAAVAKLVDDARHVPGGAGTLLYFAALGFTAA